MATWYDHNDTNAHDFAYLGYSHDTGYGYDGDDFIYGGHGKDTLYGGTGNDTLNGEGQPDNLYGGKGKDTLVGGNKSDALWGGKGVDQLYGGTDSGDNFYFRLKDTGYYPNNRADTIHDFQASDQIWLKGSYDYAGADATPGEGEYSVRQSGTDWVVTYNSPKDDGYHDIIVKGENPHGDISFF